MPFVWTFLFNSHWCWCAQKKLNSFRPSVKINYLIDWDTIIKYTYITNICLIFHHAIKHSHCVNLLHQKFNCKTSSCSSLVVISFETDAIRLWFIVLVYVRAVNTNGPEPLRLLWLPAIRPRAAQPITGGRPHSRVCMEPKLI